MVYTREWEENRIIRSDPIQNAACWDSAAECSAAGGEVTLLAKGIELDGGECKQCCHARRGGGREG